MEYDGQEHRRADDDRIEQIADRAALKAISGMFEIFGMDTTTVHGRKEIQEDFGFLRVARVGSSRFRKTAVAGIATSIVTGLGYLIWKGLLAIGLVVIK